MNGLFQRIKRWASTSPLAVSVIRYRRERAKTRPYAAYNHMNSFGYGNLPDAEKKAMFKDMRRCLKKLHFSYYEYFAYNFVEKKSDRERLEFVSNYERTAILRKINNTPDTEIFGSKSSVAAKFADFLKRDYCIVESIQDVDKLEGFLNKYKRVILKPVAGTWGRGVRIVEVKDGDDVHSLACSLIKEYSKRSGYRHFGAIVEEVVHQDERLAKLHPQSVNSVRITTIRLDTETVIFEPFLRVGRGEACVDNAGAGGIICPLDVETGVVTAARDKHGAAYETQPETGAQLIGFQVPRWDEAKEFVRKAAQVTPAMRIIGWDVALSQDGWVLIEANRAGEWVTQEATRIGLRDKITPILQKLGE